ncbi:MAG: GspH/FimT family pseudopilin [Myxococcota bacterium]|nr:GspH/FimT family pseudopilin [Myxococcota bacterium]
MRRGYTLVEIVVVVAVLGILASISWFSMGQHFPRFYTVQAAKMLKSDLMLLRKMAVQNNRETRLRFISNGGDCSDTTQGGGSWELSIGDKSIGSQNWDLLPEDSFMDNVDDDDSLGLQEINKNNNTSARYVCLRDWGTLKGPSFNNINNKNSIVFSPRGWVRNPSSDFSNNGFIEVDFVNQEAARSGNVDQLTVQLSSAGMVRVYSYETNYNQNSVGTSTSSSSP